MEPKKRSSFPSAATAPCHSHVTCITYWEKVWQVLKRLVIQWDQGKMADWAFGDLFIYLLLHVAHRLGMPRARSTLGVYSLCFPPRLTRLA